MLIEELSMSRVMSLPIAIIFALTSCNNGQDNKLVEANILDKNIAAGPQEKAFDDRYGVKINLPMQEDDFIKLLDRLKLTHSICGLRGTSNTMPTRRQESRVDLTG